MASTSLTTGRANGATVLLITDMISAWDFPDAEKLVPGARSIAPAIARLKKRCDHAGIPVIYANDNRGRWRSDFALQVRASIEAGEPGTSITQALIPTDNDYFILKPSQSAFLATPLDLLLRHLKAERVLITGVASDQCILATALGARMKSFEVVIPKDCVATQGVARNRAVLKQFEEVHRIPTTASSQIRLVPRRHR